MAAQQQRQLRPGWSCSCGGEIAVLDSRPAEVVAFGGEARAAKRRRLGCVRCDFRTTTFEVEVVDDCAPGGAGYAVLTGRDAVLAREILDRSTELAEILSAAGTEMQLAVRRVRGKVAKVPAAKRGRASLVSVADRIRWRPLKGKG